MRPPDVPRVLFSHGGDAMRRPSEIRVDKADYAHARTVLIARHPGDIAVSRYFHLKHRSRDRARQRLAEQPLESFVWADQGGIPSIVTFLNQFAALPGITVLRYEDFLSEPAATLRALAQAVGLAVSGEEIADAVEFGSLANLKRLEREGYFRSSRLKQARSGDDQSFKVRKGSSGGYRQQLGERSGCGHRHLCCEAPQPAVRLFSLSGAGAQCCGEQARSVAPRRTRVAGR